MKWLAVVGETFGALIMLGIFFCFVCLRRGNMTGS
jgi:hypothetical protein